jgi:alpha-galactosidase
MFFALHGKTTSLVIEARAGKAPAWRYWGARLPDSALPEAAISTTRPLPSFSLDDDVPLSTFPLNGEGWFNQTALLAHSNGKHWSQIITASSIHIDGDRLVVSLRDDAAKITIEQTFALDPSTDVLTVSAQLTHLGEAPLEVQWLAAATLPLPPEASAVRFFSGRHQGEFNEQVQPLSRSLWRRENRRGLTSHDGPPTGFVETQDGGLYGAHLAW